jgi:hypothetical protein
MNYKEIAKKYIGVPLSNGDIMRQLNNKVKIIKYEDLINYNNVDDVLGTWGAVIILVELKDNYGHWVLLFKTVDNKIEYFDPYALRVDDALNFINIKYRLENNSYYPYLSYLLYNCPYPIEYNHHKFQEFGNHISCCGRWCVERLKLRNLKLKDFYKLFKPLPDFTSDEIVTVANVLI